MALIEEGDEDEGEEEEDEVEEDDDEDDEDEAACGGLDSSCHPAMSASSAVENEPN